MSSMHLYRISGVALLPGGVIFAVSNLLDHSAASQVSPAWVPAHLATIVGFMLTLLGLPGLYAHTAARIGSLGFAGFLPWMFGIMGLLPAMWFEALVVTVVRPDQTTTIEASAAGAFNGVAGLGLLAGPLLFGLAGLRTAVLPRPAAALLALSSLVLFAGGSLSGLAIIGGTVVAAAGIAWRGYLLMTRLSSASGGATRASAAARGAVAVGVPRA